MQTLDLATFWRRKWTIIFPTIIAVAAGAAYAFNAKEVFESTANLLVVRRQNSTEVRKAADERYFLATQAEVMGSAKIVSMAFDRLGRRMSLPMEEQLEFIRVSPMDDTDIMSVTVRDPDPKKADELVGAIVETYTDYVRNVDEERSTESVAAIVRRERELSDELATAREEYVRLRSDSPLVGIDGDGIKIQMTQLEQIAGQLASATNLRIDLDNQVQLAQNNRAPVGRANAANFRLTSATRPAGGSGYSEDLQTTQIMNDLRAARNELTEYSRRFGENHPRAKAAGEKVQSLTQEMQSHNTRMAEAIDQQLKAATTLEQKLKSEYDELLKTTKMMDQYIVEEGRLTQRIQQLDETRQVLVTTLAQARLAESELSNGLGSIDVRSLDGPVRIIEKVWPRPSLVLGLAGLLGLGLGFLIAICTEPNAAESAAS